MSEANMVFTSVVAIVGGVSLLIGFLYSMYKIAKRVEMAIGVDEEGRTLSERMHKVEHQLWPNGGSSLADQVSKIEISNDTVRRTFETIKPATTDELQLKYASLMGCLPKQITNLPLYYLIEEWYGVSYRLGGNTKAGIDCSSFTKKLFLEIYKKQLLRTAQEQYQQSTKLYSFDDMTEGDLVFFKSGRRHIGHVGVYLGNHFFVHASTSGGVMISSLHESYWNRRFAGGGRP